MGLFSAIKKIFGGDGEYSKDLDGYYRPEKDAPAASGKRGKSAAGSIFSIFRGAPPKPKWCGITIRPSSVYFLIKLIKNGEAYSEKLIPREGKAPRAISVPSPFLKNVQRQILRRILDNAEIHPAAHGFARKRSIFTAAEPHAGKRVVVAMDIRNFFDTITANRVFGVFKTLGFAPREAAALAELCVRNGRLPQGAPTSPAIANLVCKRMDARLAGLAAKHGFSYTRYADDLIFSGEDKMLRFVPIFRKIVEEEGFELAPEKSRIMRSGSRQRVLSLNLNTKVSVPRKVRRLIRAMVHAQYYSDAPDEAMLSFLYGHVALMKIKHPEQAKKLKRRLNKARKRL